ncbi:MAG: glycosyl transferase family 36 [bacterium]|jgi:cellobiose phosphorylase|nr:glycosyl transferase family 36 [bacterium]MDD3804690.1 glycosyl transferase family 36 [bacterium]MDD4152642.1 glycosyl transferase family 36 [bacterium]
MDYGSFSADGSEYIIKTPDLPRPWINYLTNGSYCGLVSQTGGGYSFWQSSGYDRITKKYPEETLLQDRPGRYVYIRDQDSGEYWSANWQPVCRNPVEWESRHGMGYTVVSSKYNRIWAEMTYFVPLQDDLEVWWVRLRNDGEKTRRLKLFDFMEWNMGNNAFKLLESSFSKLFDNVFFSKGVIYATMRFWNVAVAGTQINPNTDWGKYAFFAVNQEVDGYDCLKERFIGVNRNWSNPVAVTEGRCFNSHAFGRYAVAALEHDLELIPGETREYVVMLGIASTYDEVADIKEKYSDISNVAQALTDIRSYWTDYLKKVEIKTPHANFDLSVNYWNKYQAWVTSHWARMDSYYIGGGSIIGFRDACQDILGILPMEPERAQKRLLALLEHQYSDGSCIHNWDPVSDTGSKTGHSDDPLWLVMAVIEYIKETGDIGFADSKVDFYDGGIDTVLNHIHKALSYTLSSRSPRGLPLIGAGDWNDGLDQVGRQGYGESVMVGQQLVWMLREAADLMENKGNVDAALNYRHLADDLAARINDICWDGKWYVRATTDDGRTLGSVKEQEGSIYLNTQSWAVISGTAPADRAFQCMDAVVERLDTDYGPAIFLPAYGNPDSGIGIITRFAPGVKENGTIFNHSVCWSIIAECILKRGDRAFDIWHRSSFITMSQNIDIYKVEPYVYAEYVYGPDSEYYGEGEFTWTTGTAAWMWRACIDWIMGVRPNYKGLLIEPCLPAAWSECHIRRSFRGSIYDIMIRNNYGTGAGVDRIIMDGKRVEGNLLPDMRDGLMHIVEVEMKKPA